MSAHAHRRLVRPSATRDMCDASLTIGMQRGLVAPAVVAGLLMRVSGGVVSHAIEIARDLAREVDGMGVVIDRLEMIESEERGC